MSTILRAPIRELVMHLRGEGGPLSYVCIEMGDQPFTLPGQPDYPRVGRMHMSTPDRAKVTCQLCLEWLHA